MMKLKYNLDAKQEIEEATRFYRSRGAAGLFTADIKEALKAIGEAPLRWPKLRGEIVDLGVVQYPTVFFTPLKGITFLSWQSCTFTGIQTIGTTD